MNFIETGIDWFIQKLKYVTEPITIETASGTIRVMAAIVAPDSNTFGSEHKVHTDAYVFLINTVHTPDIQRGIRFIRKDGSVYESIIDRKLIKEFNDPSNKVRAIAAKLK